MSEKKPKTLRCPPMFDLKMCLLDLIRATPHHHSHSKRTKSSKYGRFPAVDTLHRYQDINIIHFNENMSMMNRMENIKFVPYSRNLSHAKSTPSLIGGQSSQKSSLREWGVETVSFDFSSDDRMTSTSSGEETTDEHLDYSDSAMHTSSANESFCTLCTSSFSFNNCNGCPDACGSKCNTVQLHVCQKSKRPDPIKIERYLNEFFSFCSLLFFRLLSVCEFRRN